MLILGEAGNQEITFGQIMASFIGSFIMIFSFYLEITYIMQPGMDIEWFCKENNIHSMLEYICFMFRPEAIFSVVFLSYLIMWIAMSIFLLRMFATPGEDDRVII